MSIYERDVLCICAIYGLVAVSGIQVPSSESNGLGLSQPTRDLISHGIPGVLIRAKCPKLCPQSNVSRVSQEECARLVPHERALPRAAHATVEH